MHACFRVPTKTLDSDRIASLLTPLRQPFQKLGPPLKKAYDPREHLYIVLLPSSLLLAPTSQPHTTPLPSTLTST